MHRSDSLEHRRQQEAEAAREKRAIQERTVFISMTAGGLDLACRIATRPSN